MLPPHFPSFNYDICDVFWQTSFKLLPKQHLRVTERQAIDPGFVYLLAVDRDYPSNVACAVTVFCEDGSQWIAPVGYGKRILEQFGLDEKAAEFTGECAEFDR